MSCPFWPTISIPRTDRSPSAGAAASARSASLRLPRHTSQAALPSVQLFASRRPCLVVRARDAAPQPAQLPALRRSLDDAQTAYAPSQATVHAPLPEIGRAPV